MGVVGGGLLAICLAPQVWRIHKKKSAADIDWSWTGLYAAGLAFNIVYLVLEVRGGGGAGARDASTGAALERATPRRPRAPSSAGSF